MSTIQGTVTAIIENKAVLGLLIIFIGSMALFVAEHICIGTPQDHVKGVKAVAGLTTGPFLIIYCIAIKLQWTQACCPPDEIIYFSCIAGLIWFYSSATTIVEHMKFLIRSKQQQSDIG